MTNAKGMTIYTQARYSIMYGGRETRDGYRPDYRDGKAVGGKGCVDACLQTWTPVAAPANAQSSGYWEVITRPDGSKQWAYKGAPLYTNKTDKEPGDINGNNVHDVVYGQVEGTPDFSIAVGDNRGAGAGYYWRMVTFFN
jgi:predicted lipoprotein with Yx(FWY)xxD motif